MKLNMKTYKYYVSILDRFGQVLRLDSSTIKARSPDEANKIVEKHFKEENPLTVYYSIWEITEDEEIEV